jgi:hypothetical protein
MEIIEHGYVVFIFEKESEHNNNNRGYQLLYHSSTSNVPALIFLFGISLPFLYYIERLDLSHNQLNGTIPVSIQALTNLGACVYKHPTFEYFNHKCDLHCHCHCHCHCHWQPHIQCFATHPCFFLFAQTAVELDLSLNKLTGSIPSQIFNLRRLSK